MGILENVIEINIQFPNDEKYERTFNSTRYPVIVKDNTSHLYHDRWLFRWWLTSREEL